MVFGFLWWFFNFGKCNMNLWKVFEQRYEHFLSVRVAKMALGCVWVRDDFFLDGSFNLVKDVVSGNFSGSDGFRLIF